MPIPPKEPGLVWGGRGRRDSYRLIGWVLLDIPEQISGVDPKALWYRSLMQNPRKPMIIKSLEAIVQIPVKKPSAHTRILQNLSWKLQETRLGDS